MIFGTLDEREGGERRWREDGEKMGLLPHFFVVVSGRVIILVVIISQTAFVVR